MIARLARIGWANLWRNPRRTAITVAALTLGMIMLAFSVSVTVGLTRDMIEQGTQLVLGHVQVYARGYRPDRSIFATIARDGRALVAELREQPGVVGAAPRAAGYGLVSAGEQSVGADLLGLVPALEERVSTLGQHIVSGAGLRARNGEPGGEVLLGERLARTLRIDAGDELVVLAQAADGSLGNDLYRVAGVFRTGIELVDGGLVVMSLSDLQALLALATPRIHEIAIRTNDPASAPEAAARLRDAVGRDDLDVAAWPVLAPELAGYADLARGWLWILYLIVFALAAMAVLNTMLMAVFERFREFGVLTAIGMRPGHIVLLVFIEVVALAAVSLGVAIVVGAPLLYWVVNTGIDLSGLTTGFTMSGVAIHPIMRGAWAPGPFIESAAVLVGFAVLAGLYPAARAARVNPAALTRGGRR